LSTSRKYFMESSNAYQQHIPWWSDISPASKHELELPGIVPPSQTVDVVVIGGGVAGLSAALSARSTGAQVLLLEREAVLGYGATGRNAGILSAGINMGIADLPPDSPHRAFWPETTHVLRTLVTEAAQPGSLLSARLTGSLSLAETQNAVRKLAREAHLRQEAGLQAHLWTPAQVTEATQGRLNVQAVLNALWLPDEGRIQPLTLLAHLAQQARAAGALIAGQAHVVHYQETLSGNSKHSWQLTLADGTLINTHALISAVGPTTQPTARIYALTFAADLPDSFPLFWDASPYTYADFRPGNGRLGVSGGRYGRPGVTRHDARYHQHLIDSTHHWLPELADQEPSATWAVDLQVAADMVPTLRNLGTVAPGLAIEGLGALGVLPGIILGQRAGKIATASG
jgi:glycine/D-amino acid oxidase-like deaminating enzyme